MLAVIAGKLINYAIISIEQSLSWEINKFQLVKKIPKFYGTRRFITAYTSARDLALSWPRSNQPI